MGIQKYSLYLKPSFSAFIFSHLFISLSAVTLTLSSYLILNQNLSLISLPTIVIIFFSTLIIYNFHIGGEIYNENATFREKWKAQNTDLLKSILVLSFVGVICCLPYLSFQKIFFLFHLGVISYLYVTPQKFSVRKFPLAKIFLLSYVWSGATVFVPAMDLGLEFHRETIMLFCERFLFILALAIPFDIRDFKKDKSDDLITIPVLLGIKKSKILIYTIFVLFLIISFFNYGGDFVFYSRLLSVMAAMFLINKINDFVEDSYYMFWIDGVMILHFLSLSIFYFIN